MKRISPARLAAAKVLEILEAEPFSQANETLARIAAENNVQGDDLRLTRTLVYGVLRHALTLDFSYAKFLKKGAEKLDHRFRLCLRLATYQITMLSRLPDYAVVNDTVEIARVHFRMKDQQTGFLNAVLRRLIAEPALPELPTGNRVKDISLRYSFPQEVAGLLVQRYGTHKAIHIMDATNSEPKMVLRVNRLKTTLENLSDTLIMEGFPVEPGAVSPDSVIVGSHPAGHSIFSLPCFAAGHFYVQDEASQLVAYLVTPVAGEKLLDMCSAPGGKTTHMAELSKGEAEITATDLSENRLRLVEENIARLQTPGVRILTTDEVLNGAGNFDVALVDAPCSGAGTIRRNPEIRYRISEESLIRNRDKQLQVLHQTANLVRSGGRLIYSTCSISDHENREVISRFLRHNATWSMADGPVNAVAASIYDEDGFYRTWPRFPELDGFEAVVLRKA